VEEAYRGMASEWTYAIPILSSTFTESKNIYL
jgi:hypothetical protein